MLDRWKQYKALGSNLEGEKDIRATFEWQRLDWVTYAQQVGNLARSATLDNVNQGLVLLGESQKRFDEMHQNLEKLEALHSAESRRLTGLATDVTATARTLVFAAGIFGLVLGVVAGLILATTITRPLKQLLAALTAIAGGAGDLTARRPPALGPRRRRDSRDFPPGRGDYRRA
jgi:methyl-accepting chemotaxis protein